MRPGSTEDQAIAALAEKGIIDPSPPPPARHKATQSWSTCGRAGTKDDLPLASAGVVGAGADVTSPADIACPRRGPGGRVANRGLAGVLRRARGIAEYDGGLSRPEAEKRAFQSCVAGMAGPKSGVHRVVRAMAAPSVAPWIDQATACCPSGLAPGRSGPGCTEIAFLHGVQLEWMPPSRH